MKATETMLKSEEMKAHVQDGQIVLDEPLDLPDGTRLRIVKEDDADYEAEVEAAWMHEARRRLDDLDAGRTKAVPWSEVRERLFAK